MRTKFSPMCILTVPICVVSVLIVSCQGPRPLEIARRGACESNLRIIYEAVQGYRTAHAGKYPDSLEKLFPDHLSSLDWLRCTSGSRTRYVYLKPSDTTPEGAILVYDHPENHDKDYGKGIKPCVIVLLNTGEVVRMEPQLFHEKLAEQTSPQPDKEEQSGEDIRESLEADQLRAPSHRPTGDKRPVSITAPEERL